MKERDLWNFVCGHVTERYERDEDGECGNCGEPVVKVIGSTWTPRRDRVRYAYPDKMGGGCIFRCEMCGEVIDERWRPLALSSTPTAPQGAEGEG